MLAGGSTGGRTTKNMPRGVNDKMMNHDEKTNYQILTKKESKEKKEDKRRAQKRQ
jgi:hypothetical protein